MGFVADLCQQSWGLHKSNFTNWFLLVVNIELVGLQSIYKWGTLWEIMSNVQNPTLMAFNNEIMVFNGDLMGDNGI